MDDSNVTPSRRQMLQSVAGFGALAAGAPSGITTGGSASTAASTVLLEDDFEDESPEEFPGEWNINGSDTQEVTDQSANTGEQSLAMAGEPGACWQAIANHPVSLPSEGTVVFSGAYYPTSEGEVGCHSDSRGAVTLRTSDSTWDAGDSVNLLDITLDSFVDASGNELATYDLFEWYTFEVTYTRGDGVVSLEYVINGSNVGTTTRSVTEFEDELGFLSLMSGDFTVAWDSILVETDDGGDGGVDLRSISCGETLTGEIDGGDPSGDRGNYEPVTFQGTAGQEITVDMSSAGDTYLKLYDPGGALVAEDDDGGSGYDSQFTHTLQQTGTYTIHATSYDSEATFTYELSLSCPGGQPGEVTIQTVDPSQYPAVCVYLQVDTAAGRAGNITSEDILFTEDGEARASSTFEYIGGGSGSESPIDISFVFDDTGSMSEEIDDMKAQVSSFASTLESEGFDARYSLVSFKDDVEVDQSFTSDISAFQSAVDSLSAAGGDDDPEDNFDALEAALGLNYRPDAEQVIIDITDSVAHYDGDGSGYTDWTMEEMTDELLSEGVTYVAVAPSVSELGNEQNSKQVLAENVGGRWIDIQSAEFSEILEDIGGELTQGRYLLCFSTPRPCDDVPRTLEFLVDDPDQGELQDSEQYIPPLSCDGTDLRSISCGETLTGEIDSGDPNGDRGNYEPVTFPGTVGQEVTIEMESTGDTYLKLYDPGGTLVAEDDDGGDGLNSQLTHSLQQSGTYAIHATSYEEEATFTYDLSLACTAGPPGEVSIQTIDPDEYPLVCAYLRVDSVAGRAGELTADDISVVENDSSRSVTDFEHIGGGSGSDSPIDISFVFDDTGSMSEEIDDMKAQVNSFASTLESEGFDARYSLVSFKDDVEVDQSFTSDIGVFQSAVDNLSAAAGDDEPEDNFDALEAALDLNYRPAAEQVIIDITDSVAHYDGDGSGYTDWTLEEMSAQLLSEGVTYVAVAPSVSELGNEQNSKQVLAESVGGRWIDIQSAEFSEILEDIGGELTEGRYLVCFSSPLPCNDTARNVQFTVEDPNQGELAVVGEYIPPFSCWGDEEVTACLEQNEVPLGTATDLCITLGDFDNGLSGCELMFTLPDIVTPESVAVNSSFGLVDTNIDDQTVTITASDTNNNFEEPLDSLQLGCITVEGVTEGTGSVGLNPVQVDDDDGFPVGSVTFSSDCRELTVVPGETCPVVDGTQTNDFDDDGLCEDFNGNGRLDFDDVNTFFGSISDPNVTDNVEAFDFNGNGRVDFDDINTLFEEI